MELRSGESGELRLRSSSRRTGTTAVFAGRHHARSPHLCGEDVCFSPRKTGPIRLARHGPRCAPGNAAFLRRQSMPLQHVVLGFSGPPPRQTGRKPADENAGGQLESKVAERTCLDSTRGRSNPQQVQLIGQMSMATKSVHDFRSPRGEGLLELTAFT